MSWVRELHDKAGKATPGPWEAGHYKGARVVFWGKGNGTVPIALVDDLPALGTADSNAEFIAAAFPERVRALCELEQAAKSYRNIALSDPTSLDLPPAGQRLDRALAAIDRLEKPS